jgi:hypothetical protein
MKDRHTGERGEQREKMTVQGCISQDFSLDRRQLRTQCITGSLLRRNFATREHRGKQTHTSLLFPATPLLPIGDSKIVLATADALLVGTLLLVQLTLRKE